MEKRVGLDKQELKVSKCAQNERPGGALRLSEAGEISRFGLVHPLFRFPLLRVHDGEPSEGPMI